VDSVTGGTRCSIEQSDETSIRPRPAHMASFMPEGMRTIGTAVHRAASRFAVAARDAEVSGRLGAAFDGLSLVIQQYPFRTRYEGDFS
jgi:hypothetical protein